MFVIRRLQCKGLSRQYSSILAESFYNEEQVMELSESLMNKIFSSLAIDSFFLTCQVDMLVYDYCYLICVLRLDYDLSLFNDFQID